MSTPQNDNQPVVWVVLIGVIVLAIGLAVGFGIAKTRKAAAPVPAAAVAAPAAAEASAPADAASAPADAASAAASQ